MIAKKFLQKGINNVLEEFSDFDIYASASPRLTSKSNGVADLLSSGGGNARSANTASGMPDYYAGEVSRVEDIADAQKEYARQNVIALDARQNDIADAQAEFARQNDLALTQAESARQNVRTLETTAQSDGSISGLLSRRAEIERGAMQVGEGISIEDAKALNQLSSGTDYARPLTDLEQREIEEINKAIMRIGPEGDENFFGNLLGPTTENITKGASSGASSGNTAGMFDLRDTTSTGFLNAIGGETGGGILAASMLGGLTGGFANMAFGGEFGEGAAMGALAGGGIAIGARAITANSGNIESFMRDRVNKAGEAGGKMGLMDRGMRAILNSDNPTLGIQSRHLVMSGGALSGMAFTGRRKDKRRGFNAHRGNRI